MYVNESIIKKKADIVETSVIFVKFITRKALSGNNQVNKVYILKANCSQMECSWNYIKLVKYALKKEIVNELNLFQDKMLKPTL